jgi:Tfp pilus assembly protein PilZ
VSVAFRERETAPLVAYTSDVGVGGLCLSYGETMRLGERVEVSLTTPSRWEPLVLRAEVAWQRPAGAGESGETGFAFVDTTEEDAAALKDLVATLAFDA